MVLGVGLQHRIDGTIHETKCAILPSLFYTSLGYALAKNATALAQVYSRPHNKLHCASASCVRLIHISIECVTMVCVLAQHNWRILDAHQPANLKTFSGERWYTYRGLRHSVFCSSHGGEELLNKNAHRMSKVSAKSLCLWYNVSTVSHVKANMNF